MGQNKSKQVIEPKSDTSDKISKPKKHKRILNEEQINIRNETMEKFIEKNGFW